MLRQVPVVGSLLNWWSPHKAVGKGRTLNLVSGKTNIGDLESDSSTFQFHFPDLILVSFYCWFKKFIRSRDEYRDHLQTSHAGTGV